MDTHEPEILKYFIERKLRPLTLLASNEDKLKKFDEMLETISKASATFPGFFYAKQTYCFHLLISGGFLSVEKMKRHSIEIFRKNGGQLRMSEAIVQGITRYILYSLRDKGIIEQVSRGVYRLVELPPMSSPDLVTVSLRFPNAVKHLVHGYNDGISGITRKI